ncbi:MAG TPA: S8 family serine peptidase, partial [Phycisphaerae bacterium]|nr:S8 family serine peptidase [Phycisphaerae bacterium]
MSKRAFRASLCAALWLALAGLAPAADLPAPVPQDTSEKIAETSELIVFLQPGTNVHAFARGRGLAVTRALRSDADAYILAAPTVARARASLAAIEKDPAIASVFPNLRTQYVRMAFVPNDPYFHKNTPAANWPGQWHLINEWVTGRDARVQGAWNRDVTGTGVIIGICDDSLQTTHPDLQPNYVAADSWDFGQNDPVPDPVVAADNHGTSVAGVSAARGNNSIGVTGAAPYANLAGLRIDFDNQTTAMFVDATLYHSSGANTNIKVKNHSYGISSPYIASSAETAALATSAAAGTIHCVAAGNDRGTIGEDSNKKDFQNSPEAICVAALGSDGIWASYSCYGACVAVTTPSSSSSGLYRITTTDRMEEGFGYNGSDTFPDADYTSQFGGTSSATPLASGVMALVKQVQPALDVRFAKHLLARTSTIVDATDATATSDGGWRTNAAGYRFNQNYGFGLINADALTQEAVLYTGVTPLQTQSTGTVNVNAAIPDNNTTGVTRTFSLSSTAPLEEVLVTLNITHTWRGDLEAFLTAPGGYTSRLMYRAGGDSTDNINWTFTTNAFWGQNPAGTWSLMVRDVFSTDTGTWNSYSVTARMGQLIASPCPYPPTVTGINPTDGDNNSMLSGVIVTGTNFVAGQTNVKLTRAGQPDIPGTSVNVASPATLTCDLNLINAQPGLWNIVVGRTLCSDATMANGFTITQADAPSITAADSGRTHGDAGYFSINVLPHDTVEPRQGGATELNVTFDRSVQRLTGTNADVAVTVGSVTGISVAGNQLQATLSGNAGTQPLQVGFPGIADASNASLVVTNTVCFYPLTGDVTADGTVSSLDLIGVRAQLGQ